VTDQRRPDAGKRAAPPRVQASGGVDEGQRMARGGDRHRGGGRRQAGVGGGRPTAPSWAAMPRARADAGQPRWRVAVAQRAAAAWRAVARVKFQVSDTVGRARERGK
jgi:hypothetical protein